MLCCVVSRRCASPFPSRRCVAVPFGLDAIKKATAVELEVAELKATLMRLCINNQHVIEIDVLVGDAAVGCDVIVGMPSLAKHDFLINCGRGIAHFKDVDGRLAVCGRGVRKLTKVPTPDEFTGDGP